jgi:hypothetical protein
MKKLFLLAVAITVLTSCFKQKPKPENSYCACGRVESKKIVQTVDQGGIYLYTLTVRNRCSGNYRTFYVSEEQYIVSEVKEDVCLDTGAPGGW